MQFDRCRLNWNMGHRRRDGNNIRSFMCFVWCRLSTRCHFQSFTPVIVHERQNQTKKKTRAMIQNVNDKWQLAWDLGIKWPLNITAICGFIKNRNDCRCRLENSWKKIHMPPNTHTHTQTLAHHFGEITNEKPYDPTYTKLVGYTMRDIRYKWNEGPVSVGVSSEVSLPQFKVLGHRQRAMEISLTTGTCRRSPNTKKNINCFHLFFSLSLISFSIPSPSSIYFSSQLNFTFFVLILNVPLSFTFVSIFIQVFHPTHELFAIPAPTINPHIILIGL